MTYFEQLPTQQLSKYIDKFWYCHAGNLTNTTLTIPLLHHELVFNFSDYYRLSRIAQPADILKNPKSWIAGIQTRPILSESAGKHEMIGVLFKPNGLKAFIKYHSSDFENNVIDACLIFDSSFTALLEQIQNTGIATVKISYIENYLIKKLNAADYPGYLKASLDIFKSSNDKRISIKDICDQISISNKQLIKSYQKHIGVTPIKYLQLQSINKAILYLSRDPKQSLTKLAYDLNFYDQAHFINVFKATTSMTPTKYSNYVLANKIYEGSQNFVSLPG